MSSRNGESPNPRPGDGHVSTTHHLQPTGPVHALTRHTGGLEEALCQELAALAQRCITGFSDDRPVSASLVRSRLANALTGEPPVLVLARASDELLGWCAVRRPEPSERRARLWGPVVDPRTRRTGLGSQLLRAVASAADWPLVTTDVPGDRPGATEFFTSAGWRVLHTITVLHGQPRCEESTSDNAVGFSALEEYVSAAAQRFGGHEPDFAAATVRRWRDDARFRLENLLLDPATGSLLLSLPQHNADSSELLLAELWAAPAARQRLIRAAHTVAGRQGLETVRAVTRDEPADFVACGMRTAGICHTFTPGEN